MAKTKALVVRVLLVAASAVGMRLRERGRARAPGALQRLYPATQWTPRHAHADRGRVRGGDGHEPRLCRRTTVATFCSDISSIFRTQTRPDRGETRRRRAARHRRFGTPAKGRFRRAPSRRRHQDRPRQRRARAGGVQRSQLPVLPGCSTASSPSSTTSRSTPSCCRWVNPRPHSGRGRVGERGCRDRAGADTCCACSIENLALAARVGLRGTPLLIAGDGRVSEPAPARAAELDAWLNAGGVDRRELHAHYPHGEHAMRFVVNATAAVFTAVPRGRLQQCACAWRLREHRRRGRQRRIRLQAPRGREVRLGVGQLSTTPCSRTCPRSRSVARARRRLAPRRRSWIASLASPGHRARATTRYRAAAS